jgi:type IV secretory pathway TrbF-like protein
MARKTEVLEAAPVATSVFRPFRELAREKTTWQIACLASIAACFILTLTVVELSRRGGTEVHVVEVDRLGQMVYLGKPRSAAAVEPEVEEAAIVAELGSFIRELRVQYSDLEAVYAERKRAYAHLTPEVRNYLREWFARPENDARELLREISLREVWIESVVALSKSSWQVSWREREISKVGDSGRRSSWVAVVGIELASRASASREEAAELLQVNPLGLYVKHLSWTRVSEEQGEAG